jgi:hypothetical protein
MFKKYHFYVKATLSFHIITIDGGFFTVHCAVHKLVFGETKPRAENAYDRASTYMSNIIFNKLYSTVYSTVDNGFFNPPNWFSNK